MEFCGVLERDDQSGAACFVQFPTDLKTTYGRGNLIPVRATFDGKVDYTGSLANMGGEHAVLIVRKHILAQLGKSAGDTIVVRVVLDTAPRVVTLGDDAREAIAAHPEASATWERLSYSHQREYQLWIDEAKKPETRQRRIEKMIELLTEGRKLK
jgi:hypothetical protein